MIFKQLKTKAKKANYFSPAIRYSFAAAPIGFIQRKATLFST